MDKNSDVYSELKCFRSSQDNFSDARIISRSEISQAASAQSAFKRIVSKKNLKQSALPTFLQVGLRESLSFTRSVQLDNSQTESLTMRGHRWSKMNEILLTVKNRNLSREELINLKEGGPLSSNLIEVCLSLIKHMSSYRVRTRQSTLKVLISDTAFSDSVFSYNPRARAKTSISNVLIFPLFKSAWALLVVDLKAAAVKLYEPVVSQHDIEEMQLQLYTFLKQELLLHDHIDILNTPWEDLVVERAETPQVSYEDSGVFISKLAESICIGGKPSWDKLKEYRLEILQHLFFNGAIAQSNLEDFFLGVVKEIRRNPDTRSQCEGDYVQLKIATEDFMSSLDRESVWDLLVRAESLSTDVINLFASCQFKSLYSEISYSFTVAGLEEITAIFIYYNQQLIDLYSKFFEEISKNDYEDAGEYLGQALIILYNFQLD